MCETYHKNLFIFQVQRVTKGDYQSRINKLSEQSLRDRFGSAQEYARIAFVARDRSPPSRLHYLYILILFQHSFPYMVHSFEQDLLKIIEIFKANYDGHPWHGVTTESILLRTSPKNIINKPEFIKKNLWIMLSEIVAWKRLLIEYLKGADINFNKEAEKMNIETPENILEPEWNTLIADLKSVHFQLVAELKKVLSLEVTERIFPNHLSFSQIAYGIIHSELFCLGQINILIEFSDSYFTEKPKVLLRKYLTPAHRSLRK